MDVAVAAAGEGVEVAVLDAEGSADEVRGLTWAGLAAHVGRLETARPRWVWADTGRIHPTLLDAGVVVARCQDLRQCHAILARSTYVDHPLAEIGRAHGCTPVTFSQRGWGGGGG